MKCSCCGRYKQPHITVDAIIELSGGILLIARKNEPYGWALPGGFVDYGETLEEAVAREVAEETGLCLTDLQQSHTYSGPDRDPRHHTISTVFTGKGSGTLQAGDDADEAAVFTENTIPPLAFDHENILNDYFRHKRTHQD